MENMTGTQIRLVSADDIIRLFLGKLSSFSKPKLNLIVCSSPDANKVQHSL